MTHESPLTPRARPAILVAEDDPDQSDMLRDALQDEGYTVDTAFSGDVAYRKLLEHAYDLIILDIRMPGFNGGTVLKALRLKKNKSEAPVIILSAFVTETDIAQYRADGANTAMAKPYEMTELLQLVASFIAAGARTS